MVAVHDVAAYILQKQGAMTAMKLQKLVYYAQAWHLVWEDEPLFGEQIQAWANGPVVYELYDLHRGTFKVAAWPLGNAERLTSVQKKNIDRVLKFYGSKASHWLSELTHKEDPWRNARGGLPLGARSTAEITHQAMAEYYSSLL